MNYGEARRRRATVTHSFPPMHAAAAADEKERNCQNWARTPMIPWPCQSSLVRGLVLHCIACHSVLLCAESAWPLDSGVNGLACFSVFLFLFLGCASPLSFQTRILQITPLLFAHQNPSPVPAACAMKCSVLDSPAIHPYPAVDARSGNACYPLFRLSVQTSDLWRTAGLFFHSGRQIHTCKCY